MPFCCFATVDFSSVMFACCSCTLRCSFPVKALFENLESGATVDQFLEWFPGVNREQVLAVLAFAEESLAVT